MPTPDGTLTASEFEQVAARLNELWLKNGGKKACPQCGHAHYYIYPALIGNRSDTTMPLQAHTRMPAVLVYCKLCGYSDQYVARVLGIQVLIADG